MKNIHDVHDRYSEYECDVCVYEYEYEYEHMRTMTLNAKQSVLGFSSEFSARDVKISANLSREFAGSSRVQFFRVGGGTSDRTSSSITPMTRYRG